jgi:hypothetical protein
MTGSIAFIVVGTIYMAILYVLVRPESKGPQIIQSIFGTFSDVVRGVAGQTYDSSTNTWSTGNG